MFPQLFTTCNNTDNIRYDNQINVSWFHFSPLEFNFAEDQMKGQTMTANAMTEQLGNKNITIFNGGDRKIKIVTYRAILWNEISIFSVTV